MKIPPRIETAQIEPVCRTGIPQTIQTTVKRMKRLKELSRQLNVRRTPEGAPSVGAMLDAIYHGRIALRRRDDPQQREFWVGMEDVKPQQPDPQPPGPPVPGRLGLITKPQQHYEPNQKTIVPDAPVPGDADDHVGKVRSASLAAGDFRH